MRHIHKVAMILHDILAKARPDAIPDVPKTASIEDGIGQMLRVHRCWHISYNTDFCIDPTHNSQY